MPSVQVRSAGKKNFVGELSFDPSEYRVTEGGGGGQVRVSAWALRTNQHVNTALDQSLLAMLMGKCLIAIINHVISYFNYGVVLLCYEWI